MLRKLGFFLLLSSSLMLFGCKISGTIAVDGTGLEGVSVVLSGDTSQTTSTDSNGNYTFDYIFAGEYEVTPSKDDYVFDNESIAVTKSQFLKDVDGINFEGSLLMRERIIFVTIWGHKGDFGGLAGADAMCQGEAEDAQLTGTYMAWLGNEIGSPATRFARDGMFLLPDNTIVADDWDDLTDGTLDNYIDMHADGTVQGTNVPPWTNVMPDGTAGEGNHCDNWTDGTNTEIVKGAIGITTSTSFTWTDGGSIPCSYVQPLYCVEQ